MTFESPAACSPQCSAIHELMRLMKCSLSSRHGWFVEGKPSSLSRASEVMAALGAAGTTTTCLWQHFDGVVGIGWHPKFDAIDLHDLNRVMQRTSWLRATRNGARFSRLPAGLSREGIRSSAIAIARTDYHLIFCMGENGQVCSVDLDSGNVSKISDSLLEFLRMLLSISEKGLALQIDSWDVVMLWGRGRDKLEIGDIVVDIDGKGITRKSYVNWLEASDKRLIRLRRGGSQFEIVI